MKMCSFIILIFEDDLIFGKICLAEIRYWTSFTVIAKDDPTELSYFKKKTLSIKAVDT